MVQKDSSRARRSSRGRMGKVRYFRGMCGWWYSYKGWTTGWFRIKSQAQRDFRREFGQKGDSTFKK